MKKIKELINKSNEIYDAIYDIFKQKQLTNWQMFKYRLTSYGLALLVAISPIVILITLYIYHELVYLLGLLLVITLMVMFYLAEYFYIKMVSNDIEEIKTIDIKPLLKRNILLYFCLGIIVYIIYYVIARMIL